jgi:hypothetical protein
VNEFPVILFLGPLEPFYYDFIVLAGVEYTFDNRPRSRRGQGKTNLPDGPNVKKAFYSKSTTYLTSHVSYGLRLNGLHPHSHGYIGPSPPFTFTTFPGRDGRQGHIFCVFCRARESKNCFEGLKYRESVNACFCVNNLPGPTARP